jgi:PPOX class probable F420-dependent enzyme
LHRKNRKLSKIPAWARRLLIKERVAHLATSTKNGEPTVVPICFVYAKGVIYSAIDEKPKRTTPTKLRRIRNIIENPQVSVVVDEYREDWRKLRYIIVLGRANIINSGKEHNAAISLLRKKYPQYKVMRLEERPMIKIKPQHTIAWKLA